MEWTHICSAVWCQDTAVVKFLQTMMLWPLTVSLSHSCVDTTRQDTHTSTHVNAKTRKHSQALAPVHTRTHCSSPKVPLLLSLDSSWSFFSCQALPKYVFCLPVALCTQTPPSNYLKRSRQKTGLINLRSFWQRNVSQGDSVPFLLRSLHFFLMYLLFFFFFWCFHVPHITQPLVTSLFFSICMSLKEAHSL